MAKKQGKPGVKKGQKVKQTRFTIQGFDIEHYKRTEKYTAAVQTLFDRATVAITNAAAKGEYKPDKPFSFADYPSVQAVMQKTIEGLANGVTAVIETGSRKQWLYANKKNDAFLASIAGTSKVSPAKMKKWQDKNLDALQAFQERKIDGMNLSQRVWKYVGQYKDQIELGLDVGLGEGRSAAQLARDVKENLREPNKLFRRVRDKHGNLHLSKAAKAYHPGQGVYRSSVKNAQRLTRSEINMAYRESDFLRWQNLDFVVGFEIHRSTHEPLCKCKLCERLVGRYPKTFKFKGWHPQCMCYATPILMDEATRNENEQAELKAALTGKPYKPKRAKNEVLDVPDGFKAWVAENVAAQENWASTPYFIADNFIDGQLSLGLKQGANDGGVKTIMQAIEVAKGFGIGHIDFGDATVEQANIILDALQEEFDYFGDAGIPLNGLSFAKGDMHTKKEGGHYNTQTNEIVINLDIFGDDADSGKPILEKIASLEAQRAKLQADIDKWTAKLGINPAADKMLKQDIKLMKSSITDIEIKINAYKKDIAAGHDEISLTYGYSLKDLKDRVKATIHHEFGHLFDHKYNCGDGYAGNAYNSTYGKTTSNERIAEWYAQWMMGDKDGIPQELIEAFENKTAVDTFKSQLAAIMPEIEQARKIAQEWGISTSQIDVGIQNKNMHSITQGIEQIINTGQKMLQDVNAWIAKIMPLMQEAMNHGIPVSHYAVLMKKLQGNHSTWAFDKASYTSAITELQEAIKEAKDNEQLSTLLVDVADAKAQFGSDAIHAVYDAVEKKLAQWSHLTLQDQKKKLTFEINWVSTNQKYPTWKVAMQAYQKKLSEVEETLEWLPISTKLQEFKAYKTSSKTKDASFLSELKTLELAIQSKDLTVAKAAVSALDAQKAQIEQKKAAKAQKKASTAAFEESGVKFGPGVKTAKVERALSEQEFDDACWDLCFKRLKGTNLTKTQRDKYNEISLILSSDKPDYKQIRKILTSLGEDLDDTFGQSRKDIAMWCQSEDESKKEYKQYADQFFAKATKEEIEGQYGYTAGSGYQNRPLRGYEGGWDSSCFKGVGNVSLDAESRNGAKHIKAFSEFIDRCSYEFDVWLQRGVDDKGLRGFLGLTSLTESNVKAMVGKTVCDTAFFSCGSAKGTGFDGNILNIYCPRGTKMLYVNGRSAFNGHENETIIQRNTHFRILKVEYAHYKFFIDMEVVAQI